VFLGAVEPVETWHELIPSEGSFVPNGQLRHKQSPSSASVAWPLHVELDTETESAGSGNFSWDCRREMHTLQLASLAAVR
jgi:hypothetical protein